ncbi:MAG: Flp family type IVb pilin [Firmicutes bacterium]|nr:Flp family type IVb pilin [Bacillota bacterium]
MTSLYLRLVRFFEDERGQGMVEYGLILVLVSIVVIGVLGSVGGNLNTLFARIRDSLVVPGP